MTDYRAEPSQHSGDWRAAAWQRARDGSRRYIFNASRTITTWTDGKPQAPADPTIRGHTVEKVWLDEMLPDAALTKAEGRDD